MGNMKRLFILSFLVLSFLIGGASHILTMQCEIPPFISQVVEPNILIIFDSSGSMANAIWIDGYDRSVDHSERRLPPDDDQVIFAKDEGTCYIDHNRVSYDSRRGRVKLRFKKARSGSTDICSGDGYHTQWSDRDGYFYFDREEGRFIDSEDYESWNSWHIKIFLPYATYSVDPGNDTGAYTTWYDYDYLNWLFYDSIPTERDVLKQQHDDPEQRALLTRILVAKKVVKDLVETTEDVRFGLMSFNGSRGGSLDARVSSDKTNVLNAVDGIWASGYTPLAETLEDAWDYFSDADNSPIQYWCQKNFVIIMTDGNPTRDADDMGPLKGDWDNDHGGGSEENLYEFGGSDYLDDVAYYIYQHDFHPDLEEKQNIYTYTIGFTVVNSLLKDTAFNGNGLAGLQGEWDNPLSPHYHRYFYTATNYTELKEALDAAITEIIKKISSGTAVSVLSTSSRSDTRLFRAKFLPEEWRGYLEAFRLPYNQGDQPLWDAGIELREKNPDDRYIFTAMDDEPGAGIRMNREVLFTEANSETEDADNVKLSDLLGAADDAEAKKIIRYIRGSSENGYRERNRWKLGDIAYSTPVVSGNRVYVGANDGMLHAFDINNGEEVWGFIPNNLLGKLKDLAREDYCHEYFVDLAPVVARLRVGTELRTIVICGERGGGDAYFALDVTGDAPIPLWEFRDRELGESWSIPFIGKVRIGENAGIVVAFFGSGFENTPPRENLYAIDIGDGNIIGKVELSAPPGDALNSPRAIDIDDDGFLNSLYAGDLGGNVFKVNLDSDPASWSRQLLFMTDPGQPISAPMSLTFYDLDPNHLFVYFGTGKYYTQTDKEDTTLQSFYAIKDNGSPVTKGDLTDQTSECSSAERSQGWYIDFVDNPGERVTASPLVAGGIVFFTTFEPDISDPCKAGGTARLYAVQYDTGCPPEFPVLDITGDGRVDEGDTVGGTVPRSMIIGHGLPSDIIFNPADNQIIIQTSDTIVHSVGVRLPGERIRVHTWRQVIH
ncbi:MAG: PQQ-binding-like beta-propeller repeat protein [Syntrophobacterales bacterium]|nr:MAG: PQQ-binding-like beta-propeller repeat protein [Syntrophobacterales bacterium]